MGRDSASSKFVVVYGVAIKIPSSPRWDIFKHRLRNFKYDHSLFAMSSRAVKDKQEFEKLPEPIAKCARTATEPFLISNDDDKEALSDEEKKMGDGQRYDNMNDYGIEGLLAGAIKQILGEDTEIEAFANQARSGYEYDGDEVCKPIIIIAGKTAFSVNSYEPETACYELDISPFTSNEPTEHEAIAKKISKVTEALGLETLNTEPAWQVITECNFDPN